MKMTRLPVTIIAATLNLGCATDTPQAPDATGSDHSYLMSSDSVYWVGNVLEMEIDGKTMRLERDQVDATEVALYENDVLQGTIALAESGSSITGVTFTDAATNHWIKTNGDGDIVETSATLGCEPSHQDPECPEPEFAALQSMMGECDGICSAAQGAAWAAVGTGGVMVVTVKFPPLWPFAKSAAATFIGASGAAIGMGVGCVLCAIAQ